MALSGIRQEGLPFSCNLYLGIPSSPSLLPGIGASIFAATAIYNGLKGNGYIKEAEEFKQNYGVSSSFDASFFKPIMAFKNSYQVLPDEEDD